jgi:hypothetical protein
VLRFSVVFHFFVFVLGSFGLFGQVDASRSGKPDFSNPIFSPRNILSQNEQKVFLDYFLRSEPFIGSAHWKKSETKPTLNLYFHREEYAKLTGNPLLGFYYFGTFLWKPEWKQVEFVPFIPAVPAARFISPKAWGDSMLLVAKSQGLIVRPGAPIKIMGAVVHVQTGDLPAVFVEVKVVSPTGTLLIRSGFTHDTLARAVGAAIEHIVCFARGVDGVPISDDELVSRLFKEPKK